MTTMALRKFRKLYHLKVFSIPSLVGLGFAIALLWDYYRNVQVMVFEHLLEGPLSADDPRLITHIQSSLLVPPSTASYNLRATDPNNPANTNYNSYRNSTHGFPPLLRIIKSIFDGRPPGFFVEAGALDGEFLSNTLYLEKDKGWRGLLVEPDGDMFSKLLQKNRRGAWASRCCLSTKDYPAMDILAKQSNPKGGGDDVGYRAMNALLSSRYASVVSGHSRMTFDKVQCVPLRSLLQALKVSHVDFISLDLEGVEDDVIESFLVNKKEITVDVWMVEHHNPNVAWDKVDHFFIKRFTLRGYALYTIRQDVRPYNYIFVRNGSEVFEAAFANRPSEFSIGLPY